MKSMALTGVRKESMIIHFYPLRDTAEAIDLVANFRDGVMKVQIEFDGN